jgi:hypothetical protein
MDDVGAVDASWLAGELETRDEGGIFVALGVGDEVGVFESAGPAFDILYGTVVGVASSIIPLVARGGGEFLPPTQAVMPSTSGLGNIIVGRVLVIFTITSVLYSTFGINCTTGAVVFTLKSVP